MNYTVVVDGEEITYGAYTERSRFTPSQWLAIHTEMAKHRISEENFEKYKDDSWIMDVIGHLVDMEERYEALLEELPQTAYSKPGTHPMWVAAAVSDNTYNKYLVQDNVKDMIYECLDFEDLKSELRHFFELGEG